MEYLVSIIIATSQPTVHRELMVVTPPYVNSLQTCEDYALRAAGEYLSNGQASAIVSMKCVPASSVRKSNG